MRGLRAGGCPLPSETPVAGMICDSPAAFLEAYGDGRRFPPVHRAVLRAALLVGPQGFRISDESARDNRYMRKEGGVDLDRARAQHGALVAKLSDLGVPVLLFPGRQGQDDGIYANNAWATVPGRLVVGAMRHPVRRREAAREDVRELFSRTFGYEVRDLSVADCVAELTGPLVVDRARAIAWCGLSGRCDERGSEALCRAFGLGLMLRFRLVPAEYHANVVMSVLAGRFAILHPPSIEDPGVVETLQRVYGENVWLLSDEEKESFAANCLAVTERDALFSARALRSLRPEALRRLEASGFRTHGVEVDELEKGGGSLRCLIAEVF